ncbi:hypothetical protein M9458_054288 [Cirrhinus mrigala]|uniref:ribonuclease H n=1 Tax=Cirrhinus mrigala TaxID=683832 RepID=A0ABD0MPC8_CIRMR
MKAIEKSSKSGESGPRFRLCVPPCKRYITSGDTHSMCVVCLGAEDAMSALEGADCPHCELLSLWMLRSRRALFEEGAFTSVPLGAVGTTLLGFANGPVGGNGDGGRKPALRLLPPKGRAPLSICHPPRRATSKAPLRKRALSRYNMRSSWSAVAKLNIDWPAKEKAALQRSKLDERFLRSKPSSPRRSLPFFPDLHAEIARSRERPYSARLFVPVSDYYGNVAELDERAYKAMPRVKQTLASYLSPGAASSLKAPTLPSKPLRTTSSVVGKGYSAAGQAGACLHTMSLLQAYQADLLKGLADGDKVDLEELCRTADLTLCATKETARAVGRSMAAMVVAERHLWLTLSDMKEKDRVFLLDAPLEPSGLPGSSKARPDLRVVLQSTKTTEGSPYRGRAGCTALHGVRLSSVPSGVLQGTAASSEPTGTGMLATPSGQSPAGPPLQSTPEASLERLVPLVDYLAAWKLLPNVSAWVLRTIEKGYAIQFGAPPPPFDGVFPTLVGPEQALVMEQEVETLLRKEAIEVVPPQDKESGFYNRYFIVPKKDGGLHPIIDLRRLNRSVMKFLRFAFRGEACQHRVLPFGLALSPHTFTKCVDAALVPLRLQDICILNYIDDWLILAASESLAARHQDVVLAHMKTLGLRLNAKKSVLSPPQRSTYLGVVCSNRVDPRRSQESQRGPVTHCETVSTTAGSDGSCVQLHPT